MQSQIVSEITRKQISNVSHCFNSSDTKLWLCLFIFQVHFHEAGMSSPCPRDSRNGSSASLFQDALAALATPSSSDATAHPAEQLHDGSRHSASGSVASGAEGQAAGLPTPLQAAASAEVLAPLQRTAANAAVNGSAAAGRGGAFGSLEEEGPEQFSLVGIKRSSSGILSPSKDGQKVPLKCALPHATLVGCRLSNLEQWRDQQLTPKSLACLPVQPLYIGCCPCVTLGLWCQGLDLGLPRACVYGPYYSNQSAVASGGAPP